jgi:anaerobic ribonucleoside-triphosphate reductase activating protein
MNIAHIEENSFIYGPGCRFVVWVQGCSIRCAGCWNTEMWSFEVNKILSVSELLHKIKTEMPTIEGITILGGEPLDQYEEVLQLLFETQQIGFSTMLFTGYAMSEIIERKMTDILKVTDILITDRYEQDKRTLNCQWIGSTNQQIHFLSSRYDESCVVNGNYVEITLNENGSKTIFGFPTEIETIIY